jgi:DNA repair exonuclease SbcCD ATPase subunit
VKFPFGRNKKDASADPISAEEDEVVTDVVVDVESESEPAKPRSHISTTVGKAVAFTNLIVAIVCLAVAIFYRANKVEVANKKSEINQKISQYRNLQNDRQTIATGLQGEIDADTLKLTEIQAANTKKLGDVESSIAQTRERIAEARKEQLALNKEAETIHVDQDKLIAEIQALRATLETQRGEEEGLATDREFLADQLAKTLNDLRQAEARLAQIESLTPGVTSRSN